MAFADENVQRVWDAEAEFHRGLRDRFAGQYDPPVPTVEFRAGATEEFEEARAAYEAGYQKDLTP